MFQASKKIQEAFQAANLKCSVEEQEGRSIVRAGVSGKQTNYRVLFISRDEDNDVEVRVFSLVKFPADKRDAGLNAVNECNRKYRYLKFVIDDDNDVNVEFDFPVRTKEPGSVAVEILIRIMKIVDDVYPVFMRSIWGG